MANQSSRPLRCSFCGKPERAGKASSLYGVDVAICDECVDLCYNIACRGRNIGSIKLEDPQTEEPEYGPLCQSPQEIKAYMDQYIIGQEQNKSSSVRGGV